MNQVIRGIENLETVTEDQIPLINDIMIPLWGEDNEPDLNGAIAYIGDVVPLRLFNNDRDRFLMLTDVINQIVKQLEEKKERFRVEVKGRSFRCQVGVRPYGRDITLRALPDSTPHLNELKMPQAIKEILLSQDFLNGGLVLVSGQNGNGKTTTISATVRSRLEKHGGHAITCEDPCELNIDGVWSGPVHKGYCAQRPADREIEGGKPGVGYQNVLYKAARQYPSITGGGTILMIGEIRDEETAIEALNASVAGHLVLSTIHSPSAATAIDRLINLACLKQGVEAKSMRELVAAHLSAVIHQRLIYGKNDSKTSWWDRAEISCEVLIKDTREPSPFIPAAITKGAEGVTLLEKYSQQQTSAILQLKGEEVTLSKIKEKINSIPG